MEERIVEHAEVMKMEKIPITARLVREVFSNEDVLVGFVVRVDDETLSKARIFLPRSRSSRGHMGLEDINEDFEVEVIEVQEGRNSIVVSASKWLKEWVDSAQHEFIRDLPIGAVFTGEVCGITDYGLFVHFGIIDGLLHRSKLEDYEPLDHNKGEEIRIRVVGKNIEEMKISLELERE